MMRFRRIMPIGLLALSIGLCGTITLEVIDREKEGTTLPVVQHVMTPGPDPLLDLPDPPNKHETWLSEILARPLFSPDRRPVEVGIRGLPRLTGIVVAGSQKFAIFAAPSGQRQLIVESGARVGVYQVQEIADAGVTVTGPQGTTVIRPIFDSSGASSLLPIPTRQPTTRIPPK